MTPRYQVRASFKKVFKLLTSTSRGQTNRDIAEPPITSDLTNPLIVQVSMLRSEEITTPKSADAR